MTKDLLAVLRVLFGLVITAGAGFFMYRNYSSELLMVALLGLVITWPPLVLGSLQKLFAVLPVSWQARIITPPSSSPATSTTTTPTPPADGP